MVDGSAHLSTLSTEWRGRLECDAGDFVLARGDFHRAGSVDRVVVGQLSDYTLRESYRLVVIS
jgi:hypothetical protein